ncbi:MAG: hypothetical protein M3P47_03760 [Pseudomonadota bacterium]|nr:hypothetical protein [Pseudomonadota bacterium]
MYLAQQRRAVVEEGIDLAIDGIGLLHRGTPRILLRNHFADCGVAVLQVFDDCANLLPLQRDAAIDIVLALLLTTVRAGQFDGLSKTIMLILRHHATRRGGFGEAVVRVIVERLLVKTLRFTPAVVYFKPW